MATCLTLEQRNAARADCGCRTGKTFEVVQGLGILSSGSLGIFGSNGAAAAAAAASAAEASARESAKKPPPATEAESLTLDWSKVAQACPEPEVALPQGDTCELAELPVCPKPAKSEDSQGWQTAALWLVGGLIVGGGVYLYSKRRRQRSQ